MEKINCDIIKDLLPSYIDGICSKATTLCVEEHMEGCSECRRMFALCKDNALIGDKLEQKSLDGLKKLKRRMKYQNVVCCLLMALLTVTGFCAFTNTVFLSHTAYLALFITFILMTLLIGIDYKDKKTPGKAEYITGAVSFLTDVYITSMLLYFMRKIPTGVIPFGLDVSQCGHFLEAQFIIAFIIQFAFLIRHFICIVKKNKNCGWLLCLDITGLSLAQQYASWLYHLDTFEGFMIRFSRMAFLTVLIGIAGVVVSGLICRRKRL
ncbi:MAG: zf-HC2 domain-containing protein [Butyrivibrio sp.]|nr:zf-HC2 domain-containing protein [Butyrivibrio sp.]